MPSRPEDESSTAPEAEGPSEALVMASLSRDSLSSSVVVEIGTSDEAQQQDATTRSMAEENSSSIPASRTADSSLPLSASAAETAASTDSAFDESSGGRLWKLAGEEVARQYEEQAARQAALKAAEAAHYHNQQKGPGTLLSETFMERMRSRANPDAPVAATPPRTVVASRNIYVGASRVF